MDGGWLSAASPSAWDSGPSTCKARSKRACITTPPAIRPCPGGSTSSPSRWMGGGCIPSVCVREAGGGGGQRSGPGGHQRHELPRPGWQERQRRRGGRVGSEDFGGDPRRAIAFQRELEARAFQAGRAGGLYAAPAENVTSFLEGEGRLRIGRVEPTYDRGVVPADLGSLLPAGLAGALRAGLRAFDRKLAGYASPEAILTGLETRLPARCGWSGERPTNVPSCPAFTPAARGRATRAAS